MLLVVVPVGLVVEVGVGLADALGEVGRVLPGAVPRARGVAEAVGGVGVPLLGLLRDALHLVDAHLAVLGLVDLLEELGVDLDAGPDAALDQLVDDRGLGARHRGALLVVEAKGAAEGVVGADVGVDAVADAGDVRELGEVVAAAAAPDEHVVREVPDDRVRPLLGRREAPRDQRDVLEVPGVAVGQGGAVGDAGDLVPVVPPRHHAAVLGGVLPEPVVAVEVVVHDDALPGLQLRLEDDAGLAGRVRKHVAELVERVEVQRGPAEQQQSGRDAENFAPGAPVGPADLVREDLDLLGEHPVRGGRLAPLALPRGALPSLLRRGRLLRGSLLLGLFLRASLGLLGALLEASDEPQLRHAPVEAAAEGDAGQSRRHGAQQDDQAVHLEREEVPEGAPQQHKQLGGGRAPHAGDPSEGRKGAHVVQVLPVGALGRGLVLGHAVDEGVAGLGVLDKEPAHADREGPEEVHLDEPREEHGPDSRAQVDHAPAKGRKLVAVAREAALPPHELAEQQDLGIGGGWGRWWLRGGTRGGVQRAGRMQTRD